MEQKIDNLYKRTQNKEHDKDLLGGSRSFGIRRRLTGRSVLTLRNIIFVSVSKVKCSMNFCRLTVRSLECLEKLQTSCSCAALYRPNLRPPL
jgi:hypothetical protein